MATPEARNEIAAHTVRHRLHEHRDQIAESLNPFELWTHLVRARLLSSEECIGFNDETRTKESASLILDAVESKGGEAYLDFLHCLEDEREHLGHKFAASLLKGEEFAPVIDGKESKRLFEQIHNRMTEVSDLNLRTLLPALRSKQLLTSNEWASINSPRFSNSEKILKLFSTVLVRKGPTAYLLFANCLKDEEEHPFHREFYMKITGPSEEQDLCCVTSGRQSYTCGNRGSPLVRVRQKVLLATGVLATQRYFQIINRIKELNYEGQFQRAQRFVNLCKQSGNLELYVAVLMRNCEVLVNRQNLHGKLHKGIQKAEKLCQKISSDNGPILRSRLLFIKAHFCRYQGEHEMAEKHIGDAMETMSVNGIQGEDAVLVLYERACINLSSLTKCWSSDKFDATKHYLERATDFATSGNYGLYVDHHRIRLAQLHLRSSTYHAGTCTDRHLINEARRYLEGMQCTTLTPRTNCLFHIALSDLHRNSGELQLALSCAQEAERIARDHQFDTELRSVSERNKALHCHLCFYGVTKKPKVPHSHYVQSSKALRHSRYRQRYKALCRYRYPQRSKAFRYLYRQQSKAVRQHYLQTSKALRRYRYLQRSTALRHHCRYGARQRPKTLRTVVQ